MAETDLERYERECSDALLALNDDVPVPPGKRIRPDSQHIRTVRLGAPTEVWWRSPHTSRYEIAATGYDKFVYSLRGIRKLGIHPYRSINDFVSSVVDWRMWIVDSQAREAYQYSRETPPNVMGTMHPLRRAPVWSYNDDPDTLTKLCKAYKRSGWDRIFITGMPRTNNRYFITGETRVSEKARAYDFVHRVGAVYPEVILHLHDTTQFRSMFGLNFGAVDFDPSALGAKFVVHLPNGRQAKVGSEAIQKQLKWIHVLGYSLPSLATRKGRIMFNMHSALWAAENYSSESALVSTRTVARDDPLGLFGIKPVVQRTNRPLHYRLLAPEHDPDKQPQMGQADEDGKPVEPYCYVQPVTNMPLVPVAPRHNTGYDKILCDPCSLRYSCRYYRKAGLCILPSSPAAGLARLFATRDAEQIRLALSSVLQHQAARLERVSEVWDAADPTDLETDEVIKRSEHQMKLENSLSRGAEAMIKILDPSQRTPSFTPAIDARQIHIYNPSVLVADVVKRLEAAGVGRKDIDPAMVIEAARDRGMLDEDVDDAEVVEDLVSEPGPVVDAP